MRLLSALLGFLLDWIGFVLNMDSASAQPVDPDARRTCPECRKRMSSMIHDAHTLCISCSGLDCDLGNSCDVCIDWSEVMKCYCRVKCYLNYTVKFAKNDFRLKIVYFHQQNNSCISNSLHLSYFFLLSLQH